MTTFEPGKLYLGREYHLKEQRPGDRPLLYKARHLTTHGLILGMTGSGKTGLGIILLEEILLQGIPALILDPKGDITNLLLTFPQLRAEDFAPWVDLEGARRRDLTVVEYAEREARRWREGLAEWGIGGERIAQLRRRAHFTIFTPGSEAGEPVDVLHFFETPTLDWDEYEEPLRERIGGIVSALLGLVGVEADHLQSPEHILLARIIEHVWRAGRDLDLPTLIRLLQSPPFRQVGVFELETFFPEKDRFALARSLNNLIAAPGFETWQEGTPLDIENLLRASDGRAPANIFYLAHLNDAQRMFFITLFLEATRDWLRSRSGTTDLRALLYFDEVFGYFPPHPANPPSKVPLMALIKQGRASGLGLVLSTQNPADLDYKGLTNTGTWAIGSLRAERDKRRVLEGLEGALAEAGAQADRKKIERALGSLKPRVFLFHDIHAGPPLFFHTRRAMSYLRGPLTRQQIRRLTRERGEHPPVPSLPSVAAAVVETVETQEQPPTLPPDIPQTFLPPVVTFEQARRDYEKRAGRKISVREHRLVYTPRLLALGTVRLLDRKRDVDHRKTVARLADIGSTATVDWEAVPVALDRDDLSAAPPGTGYYDPVPAALARRRTLKRFSREFADYLYYNISLTIWHNPTLKLYGRIGESRREFRRRCEEEARLRRDAALQKARERIERQKERIRERMRREERELEADREELAARKQEQLLSLGESALNLLTGRRPSYLFSRAGRKRTLVKKAEADVEESEAAIADLKEQLADLEAEWQSTKTEIGDRWAATVDDLEEFEVTPRRADVRVEFCGLAWTPVWRATLDDGTGLELAALRLQV